MYEAQVTATVIVTYFRASYRGTVHDDNHTRNPKYKKNYTLPENSGDMLQH